jgi:hypothetical protein
MRKKKKKNHNLSPSKQHNSGPMYINVPMSFRVVSLPRFKERDFLQSAIPYENNNNNNNNNNNDK